MCFLGYLLLSAANANGRRLLRIACSRGTDQEDDVSSSSSGELLLLRSVFFSDSQRAETLLHYDQEDDVSSLSCDDNIFVWQC